MGIYPVIMCGGSGVRLWPASRPDLPKQFIPLVGERSSFQETVLRMLGVRGASELLVVAGARHAVVIEDQLRALGVEATLLLEPAARDSAPAIAAAAAWIARKDPAGLAVIVSSDHHVPDAAAFQDAAGRALIVAEEGWIVTLGVRPTEPSTAFGYIKPSGKTLAGAIAQVVEAFVEKPDRATASAYIAEGYLWNSGNFVASAATLLEELDRHAPEVSAAARAAIAGGAALGGRFYLGPEFAQAPKLSIDYAVMEKTDRAAVAPATFAWSDIGAWDAVKAASVCDSAGNTLIGDATLVDSANCLVRVSEGVRVGLVGVSDLAIVVEPGAVLVTHLGASQRVKQLSERMGAGAGLAQAREPADLPAWSGRLRGWLDATALPLWWSLGADHARGGFEEALDQAARPIDAPRRCRVQARQIVVYASAGGAGWPGPWRAAMDHGLRFLLTRYQRDDGLFRTLVNADGRVADDGANLYDQAFVLLALAAAFRMDPGQAQLPGLAERTLGRVRATFGRAVGGFREAGEPAFQSNPLMHLLESALAWIEAGGGAVWEALAREVADLALERLIDPATGAIEEYYTPLWAPTAAAGGRQVWPGHQFEWAWLLDRWARISGESEARTKARRLYEIGRAGVDAARSVAVDAMDERFTITDARARLWPQTERLKAALSQADGAVGAQRQAALDQAADAARGLWRYLETPTPGLWRDRLLPDGGFVEQPAPASSFYHIVGGILELSRFTEASLEAQTPSSGAPNLASAVL